MNEDSKHQLNQLLGLMVDKLSISESQYKIVVDSYNAVGAWLSKDDSVLAQYHPEIYPQGSFALGTMIKPLVDGDELDIDLVCELLHKPQGWTQYDLKEIVGRRIKENETYRHLLDKQDGGRRCWTINYRSNIDAQHHKYHLDILPSIVRDDYSSMIRRFSLTENQDYDTLKLYITDKKTVNYKTETNVYGWPKSNPFGYKKWFESRCVQKQLRMFASESVHAVPLLNNNDSILQQSIRLLKRHRDVMFAADENKPISIIITTLAARAYGGESNLIESLLQIVNNMERYISKVIGNDGCMICKIVNPVNEKENFADKWLECPDKQIKFFSWLKKIQTDIHALESVSNLEALKDLFVKLFGESVSTQVFENYGNNMRLMREQGCLRMMGTGALGSVGVNVKAHNFHGK